MKRVSRVAYPAFCLGLGLTVACGSNSKDSILAGSTVATLLASDTNCPNGGQTLNYGIDKNGNGKLDPSEVDGSLDICNGAATLTSVVPISAGATCSQGGVNVQVGLDRNGNGVLDASEVQQQTPLCGAGGKMTSVVGNLFINNAADLVAAAGVETVTGGVAINTDGMTGDVTLPALTTVKDGIAIYTESVLQEFGSCCAGLGFLAKGGPSCVCATAKPTVREPVRQADAVPSVGISLPALTTVNSDFQVSANATLSAPALTTIDGGFSCTDANALFPALTAVNGGWLQCGNTNAIMPQLLHTYTYNPSDANSTSSLLTVGVSSTGSFIQGGGVSLNNPNLTTVTMPDLTAASGLQFYQSLGTNPSASFPALTKLANVFFFGQGGDFLNASQAIPVAIWSDFNTISVPGVHAVAADIYDQYSTSTAYTDFIASLNTIGGGLYLRQTNHPVVQSSNLTQLGGLLLVGNQALTTAAFPALTALTMGDPNAYPFNWDFQDDSWAMDIQCYQNRSLINSRCQSFFIVSNPNLTSLNLGNVNTVPGGLYIKNNARLTDLSGLAGIRSVLGTTSVSVSGAYSPNVSVLIDSDGVTSLQGLENLAHVAGTIMITNNANLTDITALHVVPEATTSNCPVFANNPNLPYCAAKNFASLWNAQCASVAATPQDAGLLDPCASSPCSGQTPTCTVDCTQGVGYSCQ